MQKHHLTNFWTGGKISFSFPMPIPPSSSTVGVLLHLHYYPRCEFMIIKMWGNVNFLWQPGYYNLLNEKKDLKKSRCWNTHFFESILLQSISRNYLRPPSLDNTILGSFPSSNSIILVEDIIRWKRCFEIFLIFNFAGDIGNKKFRW